MSSVRQRKPDATKKARLVESPSQAVLQDGGWRMFGCSALLAVALVPMLLIAILSFAVQSPINAIPIESTPPRPKEGKLKPLDITNSERLFENELHGPESIVLDKGRIYTGTHDGKIVEIEKGKLRVVTHMGQPPCGRLEDEHTCGRPLGMRMGKDGYLVVVDTYKGLFKVNVATGDKHLLLPLSTKIGNIDNIKFMNDLDITADGVIYFSDSSTKFQRREFMYAILEGIGDGRLIEFNPAKNTTRVLIDGLLFANGVQLARDQSFVLVAELGRARVHKYYLTGDKAGQSEVFADNLPVLPDNIRPSGRGGYWLGSTVSRYPGQFSTEYLMTLPPWIRNTICKVLPLSWMLKLAPKRGIIVELDKSGEVVRVYEDTIGQHFYGISEVADDAGILYLGSYGAHGLVRMDTRADV